MAIIAIDAGHGAVKAMSSSGQRVLFPSLIHPAPNAVDLGGFGQSAATTIDGVAFLVGESARRGGTPLWSKDKAADEDTLRLILVAAAELGATGPVRLATGLPLSWFGSQHQALKQALRGYGADIVLPNGSHTRFWFETVRVLPQGVAAAGPVLDHPDYAPGPYLIVDVGYRTTDYIVVMKLADGSLDFDPTAAGSLDLGMHAVHAALAEVLSTRHRTTFTAAQVAEVDTVVVRGQRLDLSEERTVQETRMARAVVQGLLEKLDSQMDQVLGLVAVGGGSDVLVQSIPGLIPPADAQWVNARGYLSASLLPYNVPAQASGR